MTARTSAPTVNVEGLPASLRPRRQWVGWKFEQRGELLTKPPYQVDGLTYAESDDPGTWNTFEAVIDAYRAGTVKGPGYALAQGGGVAYVDLDHCRDALTGDIAPWAKRIIGVFDGTHIEVSPSKCGVKILGFGRLPDNPRHVYNVPGAHPKAKVELYDCKKYTTLTGERLPESGDDLADIQDALDRLYAELFPAKAGAKQASNGHRSTGRLDDEEVIRLCRDAKNGPNFRRLWAGDTSQHDKDDSKADSALLSIIAFYTQDEAQLDRLFRRSGLMRDKWNRDDYRKRTLEFVLSQVDEKYEPAGGWIPLTSGGQRHKSSNGRHAGQESSESTSNGDDTDDDDTGELWPDRKPLPESASVPTLPPEILPDKLRPWIVDIAEIARIPLEMIAMPAAVSLGSVVGRSVGIRPWAFNDHIVVPNLWGVVVCRPGWMKSFAVEEGLKHLGRLAAAEREAYELRRDESAAEVAALEAVLDDIRRRMRETAKDGGALDDLKAKFADKSRELREAKTTERRYITHDATVEKLAELLVNNPRGMLVVRDEVYGLLRSFEKSGRENDRQFYLEGWSGTGSFTSDRIGRGTIHVPSLTLSIIGGIQPGRLRGLIDEATSGGGGDDGLIQRFQLTVWPDRLDPWEKPNRWPDSEARDKVFRVFENLDKLTAYSIHAAVEREGAIPYLAFTPIAQGIADEWRDELEHRLRSNELDDSPAFASHLAKYRSLMPSLALLFHLVEVASGNTAPGPVSERPTRLAAAWCDFLEQHARKIYDVELDRGKSAARALAKKITDGAIVSGQTVREIYRNQWSGLRSDEVVIDGLKVLEELGWVRTDTVATAGRSSQVVLLHPEFVKGREA